MCHVNLDMKQAAVERKYGKKLDLPIYYLSDVVGLALGLSGEQLGIDRHFVTPAPTSAKTAVAGKPVPSTPAIAKTVTAAGPGSEH